MESPLEIWLIQEYEDDVDLCHQRSGNDGLREEVRGAVNLLVWAPSKRGEGDSEKRFRGVL